MENLELEINTTDIRLAQHSSPFLHPIVICYKRVKGIPLEDKNFALSEMFLRLNGKLHGVNDMTRELTQNWKQKGAFPIPLKLMFPSDLLVLRNDLVSLIIKIAKDAASIYPIGICTDVDIEDAFQMSMEEVNITQNLSSGDILSYFPLFATYFVDSLPPDVVVFTNYRPLERSKR